MQILDYHSLNVRPVSGEYVLDDSVHLKNIVEYINDGYAVNYINALSSLQDSTSNNYNNLYLTEPKYIDNILDVKTRKPLYPVYQCTDIKAGNKNWAMDTGSGTVILSAADGDLYNHHFFELEILDHFRLAVRHYDGTSLRYLTLSPETSSALRFQTRTEASEFAYDTQLFNYILDEDNNKLILTSLIPHGETASHPSVIIHNSAVERLSAAPISEYLQESGFNNTNSFSIRSVSTSPLLLDLQHTWASYVSGNGSKITTIDTDNSHSKIQNNFLTTTSTNELSTSMAVNIIPLKNQITTDGNLSRSNPYFSTENETTHRLYHRLHTGLHQEYGDDSISLNYSSGTKDIKLPANSVTYFHMPSIIDPYKSLNINDSALVKCGAIAGNVPSQADKVYKHRSNDKHIDDITDIIDNTWLCTWLSGNNDINSTPVWVDRYHNHTYITDEESLSLESPVVTYIDNVTSLITKLSAQNIHVFDTRSALTFQPNCLYAYYHIGNKDNQHAVDQLSDNILADDTVLTYKNAYGTSINPTYVTDEPTHTMPDGSVMTGGIHTGQGIYVPKTYVFDGDNYATTPTINHAGSFAINFWIHNRDWTAPFGHQIIGNYITHGFGIFNESYVTPLIIMPDDKKIHVFNSQFENIDTHVVDSGITHITRQDSLGNYWFVDSNNDIYEYDITGVIQNKITSTHLTDRIIQDIEVDEDYMYLITAVEGNSARYLKYDLHNQSATYQGESRSASIWNYGKLSSNYALRIHSIKKGLSGISGGSYGSNPEAPVIIVGPDSGLTQGSTVDNYGYPWVIQDNQLYTYDISVSSNIIGVSAANSYSIECVSCDKDNNIWMLYGNTKVAKLDNNRNITFTNTLTSTPYQSIRYIDFVYEFTPSGYSDKAIVINQSLSGCTGIGISTVDGGTLTTTVLLTGGSPVTHFGTPLSSFSCKTITGADYIRKHYLNTRPRLDAKVSLTNLYNSSTTTAAFSAYTLTTDMSALDSGWHNICISLDAEKGRYDMYVDTELVDTISLPAAKFSFNNIFTRPITIGTPSLLGHGTPLSIHLNQHGHYHTNNIMINRLKIYNKPLNYFDVKCHYNAASHINDMIWGIPTGQRSYIDTVERVFKHRLPGRRSEIYNINITGLDIIDSAAKSDIQAHIQAAAASVVPVHTKLNRIVWGNDESTSSVAQSGNTISVSTPSKQSSSSSPNYTGGSQSYGY